MGGGCSAHGRGKMHVKFWSENPKGKDHSEDLRVDGNIIQNGSGGHRVRCGVDSSGPGQVPVGGSCEHSSGLSGSTKGGEFLK
jgi:hypothetical protein